MHIPISYLFYVQADYTCIYLCARKRRIFMFFMFSFLISASCCCCNLKFACSYIADLLHCLGEFSLVALSIPLFSVPHANGGRVFIRLYRLITFVLARESRIRGTTIWFYYETIIGMYSSYMECKRARTFFRPPFMLLPFIADSRERSSPSVASLALRRSPSCKTRFAGYTTVAQLPGRRGKEERRAKKTKRGKKKGISLLFWE